MTTRVRASRRQQGIQAIRAALDERGADAFVHAASDADATYLGADAFVVTPESCVALHTDGDGVSRARDVVSRVVDDPASAVSRVVTDRTDGEAGTIIAPRGIRHDAALFLERAGYDVTSTPAVSDARVMKTDDERAELRALGTAATAALDAVGARLAAARVEGGKLRGEDGGDGEETGALTTTTLTRALRVALAKKGFDGGDSRVWSVDDSLQTNRPIVVDCRPVAPSGTHLRAAWTFVVDGDGGWERRADLALDAAHRAGRRQLENAGAEASETAGSVASEVRAELTAYGFEETTVAVHGIGCVANERPQGGDDIEPGQALVIAAQVGRGDDETVASDRRTDVVTRAETLFLDDGVERLVSLPSSLSPTRRA